MGGGGHTTSTAYQSSLPRYAQPYYESLMDRGVNESYRPYEAYQGQRLAGMSADTQAGLNMASDYAQSGPGYMPYAAQLAANTGNAAQQYAGYEAGTVGNTYNGPVGGNYQSGTFTNSYSGPEGYDAADVTSQDVNAQNFTDSAAQQYMSPYIQEVLGRQQANEALRTMQEQTQRNSAAAKAGAFGGSRAAVQNQIAIDQAQRRMGDIYAEGMQSAFENAQAQFNADRNASLTAQQANQDADLQAQQLAEESRQFGYSTDEAARQKAADLGLQAQQLGEQSRQYGFDANQQAAQKAAELAQNAQLQSEQLRQSGAQLGLEGLKTAQNSADLLGNLQTAQDQMMLDRIKAQLGVGETSENYAQQQLDQAYNDFVNQRDAQRQNLQFLSSLLQGVPVSANQDVTQTQSGNNLAGTLGTLTGLQALYQLGQS